MKNRFANKKKRDFARLKEIWLPIALFAAIVLLFFYGLGGIRTTAGEEQLRAVEQAVIKASVQCYAIEGRYPPDLEYLEQNFGLSLDRQRYIIQYNAFASNIMPTILVLPLDFENADITDDGGPF